jgi:transcriptional regulator with XRE-family HTH domain
MAGMDPATLNRLEQGKGNPNLKTLERVADALGVEVVDLLGKEERRSPPEPSLFNGLEEEARRAEDEVELGRALAAHVGEIHAQEEQILQKRLDEAASEEDRRRAATGFQRAYVHTFVLVWETCQHFPAVLVHELRTATEAWRGRLLEFYAPPGRGISVDELPTLELQKPGTLR